MTAEGSSVPPAPRTKSREPEEGGWPLQQPVEEHCGVRSASCSVQNTAESFAALGRQGPEDVPAVSALSVCDRYRLVHSQCSSAEMQLGENAVSELRLPAGSLLFLRDNYSNATRWGQDPS